MKITNKMLRSWFLRHLLPGVPVNMTSSVKIIGHFFDRGLTVTRNQIVEEAIALGLPFKVTRAGVCKLRVKFSSRAWR